MKKILSVLLVILTVFCMLCSFTVSAASVKATIEGPKAVHPKEEIKIHFVVDGADVKGVMGTITYDYSILTYVKSTVSAKGWSLRANPVENQIFFSAADAENNNPVNGKAVFTVVFSTEYAIKGDKILITASDISYSTGKGSLSMADAKYENTVTDKPLVDDTQSEVIPEDDEIAIDDSYIDDEDEIVDDSAEGDPFDDIRLKSLEIENVDVDLNFQPDVKTYNINIPSDITELIVKAEPMNPKSTVTITDTKLTYPIKNITKVVVTAENGSKRTYKIYSMRATESKTSDSKDNSLALWQWIAIIGGIVLLIAAIFIIILLVLKRKKNN